MPKRTIRIQNPAKLSVRLNSLVIEQEQKLCVPLEDIWVLIIETHQATITSAALSSLADAGIGVMTCGENHMPNGLALPIEAHSRHAEIVENQLALRKPFKKQIWKRIVVQKIKNQARVLEMFGHDTALLKKYASKVLSDDSSGREAVAAAQYFKQLLPEGTRREGPYVAPLDYGYGILRAGIGRVAVSGGWLVSQGVHHRSSLNAFNLVDDFIEPFRPLVDLMIMRFGLNGGLTVECKQILAQIFEYSVGMDGKTVNVQAAIEVLFHSFREAVVYNDTSLLLLPSIIELKTTATE